MRERMRHYLPVCEVLKAGALGAPVRRPFYRMHRSGVRPRLIPLGPNMCGKPLVILEVARKQPAP